MAAERTQSLQDTFLNYVRKNKTPLTIFLVNGVKLQGIVTWFDNFCVLLRRDGHSQLVYKHAAGAGIEAQLNSKQYDGENDTDDRDCRTQTVVGKIAEGERQDHRDEQDREAGEERADRLGRQVETQVLEDQAQVQQQPDADDAQQ